MEIENSVNITFFNSQIEVIVFKGTYIYQEIYSLSIRLYFKKLYEFC